MDWPKIFTVKNLWVAVGITVGSELVWRSFLWAKEKYQTRKIKKCISQVLFFPDNSVRTFKDASRRAAEDQNNGDKVAAEDRLHQGSSLFKMLKWLSSAEQTLDICIFLFTCHEFANLALECQSRGVVVRLIVEQSSVGVAGCQVGRLRQAGVRVRTRRTPGLMHHKFALVDNSILVNGSFNWTG